jgi:hypothetical protein
LHFRRASPVDLARALLEAAEPETRARIGASLTDTLGRDAFLAGLGGAFSATSAARGGASPHPLAGH